MDKRNDSKNNLFGIIKYWAAFSVFLLHFCGIWRTYRGYLLVIEKNFYWITFFPPVIIFLAVSGYLTAGSLDRSRDLKDYFLKRIRRIYIPLWVSTVVYLIVYLVIARQYLDGSIILWLLTNSVGIAYTPSCLSSFATGSANGVLWTITVLLELYVLSALLWKYIRRIPGRIWLFAVLPVLAGINLLSRYVADLTEGSVVPKLLERTFIPYAVFFFLGMAAYIYRDKLGNGLHIMGLAAFGAIILYVRLGLGDYGYYTGIVRGLCTAVAAVGIGSWSPEKVGDHGLAGLFGLFSRFDFTYEIYLYQWAIFNVLVTMGMFQTCEWYQVYWASEYSLFAISLVMYLIGRLVIGKTKVLDKQTKAL